MGESTKTALITRMAEYGCKTKIGHTEYWTIQREVSAAKVEDLEAAAKSLIKTIGGCHDIKFTRFLPTAKEAAEAAKKAQAAVTQPKTPAYEDPCVGEWSSKSICKR